MERNKKWRMTLLCCAALTLCFGNHAAAEDGPAHFDEGAANVAVPREYLPPLVALAEEGKRRESERPLETALRDALYQENGALRTALDACNGAAASAGEELDYARQQMSLDEQTIHACEGARETGRALLDETEKENRGLRLTLAGIKWILLAVGAAAGAILLLH
ncbi:MAG: hypothetical protein HZA03_03930 [Nitrospinae bacterium]|nr:hypothetical protein [Nitrospinota bacterium]